MHDGCLCHSRKEIMNTQIVPIECSEDGALIVSSLTIAEGAEVTHQAVLKLIDQHAERLGQVGFEIRAGYNNAKVRVALLDEKQATALMMLMKNTDKVLDFKFKLNDAFFEMAHQLQTAPAELSRMQILQMALESEQKNLALEAQIKEDAPRVEYVKQFVAADDRITFRTLAGNLGIPESELRELLIDRGWIYREVEQRWSNTAGKLETRNRYSAYADKKPYFQNVLNHEAPRFKGGDVMHTLKITPAGAEAIARLHHKEIAA